MSVSRNDLMAIVTYVHVQGAVGDRLTVKDVDRDSKFDVIGKSLIDTMLSADSYTQEKKTSLTEVAEILSRSYNTPFTVEFTKKDGELRKLRGRLTKTEPILGRCYVEDLDVTEPNKTRLVDNRTLISLIVNGTKYVVK